LNEKIVDLGKRISSIQKEIDSSVSPSLQKIQTSYSELVEKRAETRRALKLLHRIHEYKKQKDDTLESAKSITTDSQETVTELSKNVLDRFAKVVEEILESWHFPDAERVFFDESTSDLIISGKLRTSHGKGLRAITHAAFTIALIEYCRRNDKAHPGFIVLDSPLLAYKEPEGIEDDLRGTDLKDKFYEYIVNLAHNLQIIIAENEHPSESTKTQINFIDFTGNPDKGRKGFFPE